MIRYYELPIQFSELMKPNVDLPTCELKKSIAQNIYLIITSKYNEHRFDETYGCEIWDMDFELIHNESTWRDRIGKSVSQSIGKHEKRLENVMVNVNIGDEEVVSARTGIKNIRKKITIRLNATIRETGDKFNFSTNLYLGPISFD